MQHNRIKNPNWQVALYKRHQGFELGTSKKKSSKLPEWDSNQGPPDCESDVLTFKKRKKYFISDIDDSQRNLLKKA